MTDANINLRKPQGLGLRLERTFRFGWIEDRWYEAIHFRVPE